MIIKKKKKKNVETNWEIRKKTKKKLAISVACQAERR